MIHTKHPSISARLPLSLASPELVAKMSARRPECYGLQKDGVVTALKSFPEDGDQFLPPLEAGDEVVLFSRGEQLSIV